MEDHRIGRHFKISEKAQGCQGDIMHFLKVKFLGFLAHSKTLTIYKNQGISPLHPDFLVYYFLVFGPCVSIKAVNRESNDCLYKIQRHAM